MKAFTKILALALAMVMIFAMVGCDTENQDNGDTTNPPENGPEYNIGQVELMKFPIDYRVKTDAKSLNIGDTLTITVSLKTADLADLDATFEIGECDSYEILGQRSYSLGDLPRDEEYVDLTFEIKFTKENYVAEKILFTFNHDACNKLEKGESIANSMANAKNCKICSYGNITITMGGGSTDTATKVRLYINNLGFVADSQGVIISKDFEQSKDNDPKNLVEIMTESLNREYGAGVSTEVLMGRILEFENCGKVFFNSFDSEKLTYAVSSNTDKAYLSKNLRVRVILPDLKDDKTKENYPELFDRLGMKDNEALAAEILLILLERGMISQAEYDAELSYLKDHGIISRVMVAKYEGVLDGSGSSSSDDKIYIPVGGSSTSGDGVITNPGSSSSSGSGIIDGSIVLKPSDGNSSSGGSSYIPVDGSGVITGGSSYIPVGGSGVITGGSVVSLTFVLYREGAYIIKDYTVDYTKLNFSVPTGDDYYHFVLDLTQP